MEALIKDRRTVALVRIDVQRWDSPVARQYHIRSLPQLWLHDGHELRSKDTSDVMDAVQAAPRAPATESLFALPQPAGTTTGRAAASQR